MDADRQWMERCLSLARSTPQRPSPNPRVACVIVRGDQVVGEGVHLGAGQPHAEVLALQQAGSLAKGATLYVNLEPCNHYGRTPPCTEAILAAGIRRVVVGMQDPNPLVAGKGIRRLQEAGVEVTVGVLEQDCQELNEGFAFAIVRKQCFGLLKYAMTLDGKSAATTGHSQWISNPLAREWVHRQRAWHDTVIVGSQTVWHDNPRLTCRLPDFQGSQPLRVVLSRSLNLPPVAHLWQVEEAPTLVITEATEAHPLWGALAKQGVELLHLDRVTPARAAQVLFERGCLSALWECGGTLAWAALKDGAIQKVAAFIAPKILGGANAPTPVEGEGIPEVNQSWQLLEPQLQTLGDNWLISGKLAPFPLAAEAGLASS
ncbi:bifunctional diaminohydroxyphosphoribosylaminopyrimidine deaminase/5-amino-6-(5-phosphoribosylamino)uracil reductase RibD [Synechococcus sp. W65.1]|uniref:bifunctional diaminohydroxyphosphoribosylaminopyrimidine deaminase/5-amino-6-(5-phosphoribosylamino)uracil reductase RibD n=1 Tax=Synechococcus sp. W65.1 TaxID=2964526 RepID=UPI0039C298F0